MIKCVCEMIPFSFSQRGDTSQLLMLIGGVQWLTAKQLKEINQFTVKRNISASQVIIKSHSSGFHYPVPNIAYHHSKVRVSNGSYPPMIPCSVSPDACMVYMYYSSQIIRESSDRLVTTILCNEWTDQHGRIELSCPWNHCSTHRNLLHFICILCFKNHFQNIKS